MDTLIRGGTVVNADGARLSDVLVSGQIISAVGPRLSPSGAEVIDASGMHVVPGGVDVHTHLDIDVGGEKASDDWYTGTLAAACGGTTAVVDHPGFGPRGCSLFHQIEKYRGLAGGTAVIDYSFHGVVQHVDDPVLADLEALVGMGISSVKAYLTYDFRLSDEELIALLQRMRELGGLTAVHCENHGIVSSLRARFAREGKTAPQYHALSRPAEAEAEAVSRMIRLSEAVGGAPLYVVHLSSRAGLEEVRRGRARGLPVFAETCPQYLLLGDERYGEPDLGGLKYVMSPPLRKESDRKALWEGLGDGSIQTVATDHCPFFLERKKEVSGGSFLSCPNGAPGIETRMALLYSEGVAAGRIGIERFVELTSTAPARIMGLHPRKGAIAAGSDADIVLVDPKKRVRLASSALHQRVDYTPFEGFELRGYPVLTMLRGKVIFQDGRFMGARGEGLFLPRGLPDLAAP